MAKSSNLSTSNEYIKYTIEVVQNSQSVSDNTSNVTVNVRVFRTNTGYETYGSGTLYCKINGTTYSASISSSQKINYSGITLFTKQLDIGHNSDGTKTLTCSAWISHSNVTSSEQSYSQILTTIARASIPTLSANSISLGQSMTIYANRKSTAFTHQIHIYFGKTAAVIQNVTDSYVWTAPTSWGGEFPTTNSNGGTIYLLTYNGAQHVGTVGIPFTLTVPSSAVPTISSLSLTRVDNTVPASWGVYVENKSSITATINGEAGSMGSTIVSRKITGPNINSNASSATAVVSQGGGTYTYTATVTDSRGRTATKTASMSVIGYHMPMIYAFSVERCNSDGTYNPQGTVAKAAINFVIATVSNKNSKSWNLKYRRKGASTWVTLTSDTTYSYNNIYVGGTLDLDESYDFQLTITDSFTSVIGEYTVGTGFTLINFGASGKSVAFGKVSANAGEFELAMPYLQRMSGKYAKTVLSADWCHNETDANIGYFFNKRIMSDGGFVHRKDGVERNLISELEDIRELGTFSGGNRNITIDQLRTWFKNSSSGAGVFLITATSWIAVGNHLTVMASYTGGISDYCTFTEVARSGSYAPTWAYSGQTLGIYPYSADGQRIRIMRLL